MGKIESSTKGHEIMRDYPELTDFLVEHGICGCNDGHISDLQWPLSKIAKEKGMDLQLLLEKLNERIE
jgi:hypothetical protein